MRLALIAASMVLASITTAQAQEANWRIVAGFGYANGGETIRSGTITTIGTNKVTPFDIEAGSGVQVRLGADYRLTDKVTVQATIGHASSDPMGMNGSYDFKVIPLELMAFLEPMNGYRIGAGVRKSSASLSGKGVVVDDPANGDYSSSAGAVLELQYLFNSGTNSAKSPNGQFGLGLRAVRESFSHPLGTINGDHYEIAAVLYY
jgi:opacity protein-like surface antigen